MDEVSGDLRQRLQDKTSLVETGVGYYQVLLLHREGAEEKDIEVASCAAPSGWCAPGRRSAVSIRWSSTRSCRGERDVSTSGPH